MAGVPRTGSAQRSSLGIGPSLALVGLIVVGGLLCLIGGADGYSLLTEIPFAAVGVALVIRRPRNTIGWLLIAVAVFGTVSAIQLAGPDQPLLAGTAPFGKRVLAWLTSVIGFPIFTSYALLAVIFPSGQLPGGRWGTIVRALIALNVVLLVVVAVAPNVSPTMTDGSTIDVPNPFALMSGGSWSVAVNGVVSLVILLSAVLGVGSFVLRLRSATGLERQQMRWVVASLVMSSVAVAIALPTGLWALAFLAFATIPIAIGIAVLRYRLYDIDRLISRSLAYGLLAGCLLLVYGGTVLLLTALLAPLTSENSLAVAGSTLLVAALFAPVRRRVQSLVDRRFDRARYDATRELADLSQRLRNEVDLEGVTAEVVMTIRRTLAPASASIWLVPARGESQASSPAPLSTRTRPST